MRPKPWCAPLPLQELVRQAPRMQAQDYSNTLWAMAHMTMAGAHFMPSHDLDPALAPFLTDPLSNSSLLLPSPPSPPPTSARFLAQPAPPTDCRACLHRLLASSEALIPTFSPQQLSNVVWAAAVLHTPPTRSWCLAHVRRTYPLLPRMSSQEASNLVWAYARLSLLPPRVWVARYFEVTALLLPRGTPQHLSSTAWACARMGMRPPQAWCDMAVDLLRRWSAGGWGGGGSWPAQEQPLPAVAADGPAQGQGKVGGGGGLTLQQQQQQQWEGADSVARGQPPPQVEAVEAAPPPQAVSVLLSSLAQLSVRVDPGTLQLLLAGCCEARWHLFHPQGLVTMLHALHRLGLQPAPGELQPLLAALRASLPSCTAQGLSVAAWALCSMDYFPEDGFMYDLCYCFCQQLGPHGGGQLRNQGGGGDDAMGEQAVTNLLWAMGCWRYTPGAEVLRRVEAWLAQRCRLHSLSAMQLTSIALSLTRLRHR